MKRLLIAFALLTLTACQHQMPQEAKPLTFDGQAYYFNVSRIDVIDDFATAHRQSRTEYKPDTSLAEAMHKWVDARLTARGKENVLEIHITNADIFKNDIAKQKTGIEGFFTKEQTEEYNGKLAVELKLYSPERTLPVAHAEISADLTRTLQEDATLEDRKALYRSITAAIMAEMDKMLDRNIHTYFSTYLL